MLGSYDKLEEMNMDKKLQGDNESYQAHVVVLS